MVSRSRLGRATCVLHVLKSRRGADLGNKVHRFGENVLCHWSDLIVMGGRVERTSGMGAYAMLAVELLDKLKQGSSVPYITT